MKCPKCHSDNPDTSRFCAECGTQLPPTEEISVPYTETLETPTKELTRGTTFAGRYEVIEELGKVWVRLHSQLEHLHRKSVIFL